MYLVGDAHTREAVVVDAAWDVKVLFSKNISNVCVQSAFDMYANDCSTEVVVLCCLQLRVASVLSLHHRFATHAIFSFTRA